MSIRRLLGRVFVLAAVYAFALQGVLAAAAFAAHAAAGPSLPSILCSGPGGNGATNAPVGNDAIFPGCAHCVMSGCNAPGMAAAPASVGPVRSFAAPAAQLSPRYDIAADRPAIAGRIFPRAPPQA